MYKQSNIQLKTHGKWTCQLGLVEENLAGKRRVNMRKNSEFKNVEGDRGGGQDFQIVLQFDKK